MDVPEPDELEWNTAGYRVYYISQLTMAVRQQYMKARMTKEHQEIVAYYNLVSTLYEELRIYMEEETRDEIDDAIDELDDKVTYNQQTAVQKLGDIRDIDRELQQARKNVGLDIPSKDSFDPENAFAEGGRG